MLPKQPTHRSHPTGHKGPPAKTENVDLPAQGQSNPAAAVQRAKTAPGTMTTGDVLLLQGTVGNQAVGQLLGEMTEESQCVQDSSTQIGLPDPNPQTQASIAAADMPTPAPRNDGDLSAKVEIGNFAYEAYQYLYKNPTKTVKEFIDDMVSLLNKKLLFGATPKYTMSKFAPYNGGAFFPSRFEMHINLMGISKHPIGALNHEQIAQLVGVLIHEARHAQQTLRIAQMQAGQGKDTANSDVKINIPPEAAKAAKENRLDPAKPENATRIAEAQKWEPFIGGKHEGYQIAINTVGEYTLLLLEELENSSGDTLSAHMVSLVDGFQDLLLQIQTDRKMTPENDIDWQVHVQAEKIWLALSDFKTEYAKQQNGMSVFDQRALRRSKSELRRLLLRLYNTRFLAYQNMEHEKDAWAVGEAAEAIFSKAPAPSALSNATASPAPTEGTYELYHQDVIYLYDNLVESLSAKLRSSSEKTVIASVAALVSKVQDRIGKLRSYKVSALTDHHVDISVYEQIAKIETAFSALQTEYILQQQGMSKLDKDMLLRLVVDLDTALYEADQSYRDEKNARAAAEAAGSGTADGNQSRPDASAK